MRLEFHQARGVVGPSKKQRLLTMLREGQRGTMQQFATRLKTTPPGVRSFINSLRSEGHPIFNEVMPHTHQTRYFLAKPKMKDQQVNNKMRTVMEVPRGKRTLVIK